MVAHLPPPLPSRYLTGSFTRNSNSCAALPYRRDKMHKVCRIRIIRKISSGGILCVLISFERGKNVTLFWLYATYLQWNVITNDTRCMGLETPELLFRCKNSTKFVRLDAFPFLFLLTFIVMSHQDIFLEYCLWMRRMSFLSLSLYLQRKTN